MKKRSGVITKLFLVLLILGMISYVMFPLVKQLKFGLDLQGGFEVLYEVNSIDGTRVTKDMVTNTYKTIEKRIDVLGVSEPSITVEGENKIRVQLAGITNPEEARNILSKAANLTFRGVDDTLLMNSEVLKSGGAKIGQDESGRPAVALSVKDKEKFYEVTKKISGLESPNNRIVIWLDFDEATDSFKTEESRCGSLSDSRCLSVASVSQGFASDVIIQGDFTEEEVKNLVELINSGSLPTKLEEISSKTVGASFGEDSLQKTAVAGLIGVICIMLFMTLIYRFAGFVSSVGIVIYAFCTFLVFWLVGGVLTLPGIAAMVIGVGMAIDACVLNFARIKEELYEGNKLSIAFQNGNKHSFMTILDANLTTLLVAVILFIFGESSIKGFATMLIISIFVTMIIMVFVTRFLLKLFVDTGYFNGKESLFIGVKKKDIPGKKEKRTHYEFSKADFVKPRKWYFSFSVLVILIGLICTFVMGVRLGVDFKGGSSITLKTEQSISSSDVKHDLEQMKFEVQDIDVVHDNMLVAKIANTLDKEEVLETEKFFQEKYKAETDIGVVSNVVKKELVKNAILSVLLAFVGIVIYIALRYTMNYAVGAIVSLLHDVLIMIAFFSIFRLEVSTLFIAAILSIIGYSINDTIVTFDRIRENKRNLYHNQIKTEASLSELVNNSLRQTLMRSIITTITTLIPVLCLILFGSHEIINFNIALFVGLVFGVYSSIFIASQLWYEFEKRRLGKPEKKKWYEEDLDEQEELQIKGINA